MAHRFTREGGLIHLHLHSLHELAVGTYLIPRGQQYQVAHDDLTARNLCLMPIAYDTHRFTVILLVEQREFAISLPLKPECQSCGQCDSHDDADRLKESGGISPQSHVLIDRNADAQHGSDQQDDDERVSEFLCELAPPRRALAWRQHIGAVCRAAGHDLCSR